MLDIDGYLTSTEFLFQVASLIAAILSVFVDAIVANWFSGA